jgi:hypothetical protein
VTLTATLADNGGGAMQGLPLASKTVNYTLGSQGATKRRTLPALPARV